MNKFFLFCVFTSISIPLSGMARSVRFHPQWQPVRTTDVIPYLNHNSGDLYTLLRTNQIDYLNKKYQETGEIESWRQSTEQKPLTITFKGDVTIRGVVCNPETRCVHLCNGDSKVVSPCTINHNPLKKRYYAGLCVGVGALCFLGYYFRDSLAHCARNPSALSMWAGIKSVFAR